MKKLITKWYHLNSIVDGKPILSFLLVQEGDQVTRIATYRKISTTNAINKWLMRGRNYVLEILTPHDINIAKSVLKKRYLNRKKFICNGGKKNDLWIDINPQLLLPRDRKEYDKIINLGNYVSKIDPYPTLTPFEKKILKSSNHDFPLSLS